MRERQNATAQSMLNLCSKRWERKREKNSMSYLNSKKNIVSYLSTKGHSPEAGPAEHGHTSPGTRVGQPAVQGSLV